MTEISKADVSRLESEVALAANTMCLKLLMSELGMFCQAMASRAAVNPNEAAGLSWALRTCATRIRGLDAQLAEAVSGSAQVSPNSTPSTT